MDVFSKFKLIQANYDVYINISHLLKIRTFMSKMNLYYHKHFVILWILFVDAKKIIASPIVNYSELFIIKSYQPTPAIKLF